MIAIQTFHRRWRIVFCASFLVGLSNWSTEHVVSAERPNILLIYTDDQGFGDVSYQNAQCKFQTPNMDRLAREGLAFLDAHCSDTVCTPSRYGLLTGRYAWRTRLKSGVFGAEAACLISDQRMTIASMLQSAGYQTAMVGKWHLGMDFPGTNANNRDWSQPTLDMPLDKGFDYYFGVPASLNYGVLAWFEGRFAETPPTLFTAKKANARHVDYRIMPPYETTTEEVLRKLGADGLEVAEDFVDNQCLTKFADRAIQWLDKWRTTATAEQPFFLYLPFTAPHYPVCPLPEFEGQGSAGAYGEFVIETDFHIGRILDYLDQHGLTENTLVIFTSDNGPENSWKQRIEEFGHRSNGRFREGKRSIYEGGHRVPFFVRWPAKIQTPDRLISSPICQTDVMATLAEILDVELPDDAAEDSHSFLAHLTTPQYEPSAYPIINHAANGRFAVRLGNWKYVAKHRRNEAELYNLEMDPEEQHNCLTAHASLADELLTQLTNSICRGRTSPGTTQLNDTAYWDDISWIS
ncbi:MAG: arylsulfatase [Planctomycetales bacterium]|nr:arylsulfatase [Planctomycetales bacterium]